MEAEWICYIRGYPVILYSNSYRQLHLRGDQQLWKRNEHESHEYELPASDAEYG